MQTLKEFRERTGLSQCNMARRLDMSQSFYEKVERGHSEPSRGFMQKLKAAFPDVSIDEIFFSETKAGAAS